MVSRAISVSRTRLDTARSLVGAREDLQWSKVPGARAAQPCRAIVRAMRVEIRVARFVAMGIALGWLAYTLASWFLAWNPADAAAYYQAAQRLAGGAQLYPAMNPEAHEVYRYAPWFAVLWIPL